MWSSSYNVATLVPVTVTNSLDQAEIANNDAYFAEASWQNRIEPFCSVGKMVPVALVPASRNRTRWKPQPSETWENRSTVLSTTVTIRTYSLIGR